MNEIISILLLIGGGVLVMPIVALIKASAARREAREAKIGIRQLEERNKALERSVQALMKRVDGEGLNEAAGEEVKSVAADRTPMPEPPQKPVPPVEVPASPLPVSRPPAIPRKQIPVVSVGEPVKAEPVTAEPVVKGPSFSLEQFMGVKLFAWLGGVAMFFGVIFFVKYAFERNLIPPAVRVALGFAVGAGLLVGGLWTHRKEAYRVLAQSLCATGVLVLYGVSFAAHAVYHFDAFSPPVTFGLMSLVTAAAFLIAVRLDALVVAVMGMIGGFLSPVLLPMVQDSPFALFSYVALLDVGLLAVSRFHKWSFLSVAAAVGTVLMQILWFARFFGPGDYDEGAATLVPMGILVFFCGLFVVGAWWTKRTRPTEFLPAVSALGVIAVSMIHAFVFLAFRDIADRPFLLYGFVLALNFAALVLGVIERRLVITHFIVAVVSFLHLALWTTTCLGHSPELFGGALAIYLVFGALHASYPVLRKRFPVLEPESSRGGLSVWFGPLVLVLILISIFVLPEVPLMFWAAVLIADLLVIGLAFRSGLILPVLASLVLTLVVAGGWLMVGARAIDSLAPLLVVIVLFGALFAVVGVMLGRRGSVEERGMNLPGGMTAAAALPMMSGVLPFVLLILAVVELPIANPSPVFGVSLLLGLLLLGLTVLGRQSLLPLMALFCTLAVEGVWHASRFSSDAPWTPLLWYLGFYVIYTLFPFVFRKACGDRSGPWIASSLSGVGHFLLVHDLVRRSFGESMGGVMGLVPVAFAVPTILALLALLRGGPGIDEARQRTRLAWFGGVALLFITLVFPIQFDRQWLTVSWALEGAAVLWLFRRLPHRGLKWTGIALLTVAFVRLAFNPAVLNVYERSGVAIFNWHLYSYGLVAAAVAIGGRLLPDEERKISNVNVRAVLYGFCGVLLFMLLNIEIADFFTEEGQRFVSFQFGGDFARQMTYSIAWGLFSLGLLGLGIWKRAAAARYAAIGLLAVTLIKVFLHDLSTIDNIYRIGALIGVSIIAFIASFLYQRFFKQSESS